MMRRLALMMTFAGAALFATAPLGAQGRGRGNGGVPPGHQPPPGMCRIWIDGVPPGQQPAPTDCASAVRNRPSNGRVLFGDDAGGRGRGNGRGKYKGSGRGSYGDYDDDRDEDRGDGRYGRGDDRGSGNGTWGDVIRGGSNSCVDNNRDGRCDDTQRTSSTCPDRNRDGYCDVSGTSGNASSLPPMIAGILIGRGQRTSDVGRWLGGNDVTARVSNVDRNGVPARVMWYDRAGQLLQVWTDHDRDGRADRVEQFANGRRVRVIGQ